MAKMGRPSIYTAELGDEICRRLSLGESLLNICKDPKMPDNSTVYLWLLDADKADFFDKYTRARASQAEIMFDDLLDIADKGDDVARARLRVDTRKWYLSKVLPKKFGEKIDLTSGGERIAPVLVRFIDAEND